MNDLLAEREGFEPPIAFRLCLISSQVRSTGLRHLSDFVYNNLRNTLIVPFAHCAVNCAVTGFPHSISAPMICLGSVNENHVSAPLLPYWKGM